MLLDTATLPCGFGPYTLLRRIGQGGMAEVYLASHEAVPGATRMVALKLIQPTLVDEKDFVEMFLDEARVLAGLYHPNLDRVLDVGEIDGRPYLALDYLPGRDLAVSLRRHEERFGPFPLDVAAHVVARVAAGLGHAHGRTTEGGKNLGIVHRDVSPENVILTFEGTVKVVDFGIARGVMRSLVTEPGLVKGKPSYMAPEQILAKPIDRRTDLFALGVLLYRLTVGRHPFGVRSNDASTFVRLIREEAPPPHRQRAGLPRSLSSVILKALEKPVEKRYQRAEDLIADLETVMKQEGWFPSERRLAELMAKLFPEAVDAARRFSEDPEDTMAAHAASYLSTASLRGVEIDPEAADRRLATPAPGEEESTVTETETETSTAVAVSPKPRAPEPLPPPVADRPLAIPPRAPPIDPPPVRDARLEAALAAPVGDADTGASTRSGVRPIETDDPTTVDPAPPAPRTERPTAPRVRPPVASARAPDQAIPAWRHPVVIAVVIVAAILVTLVVRPLVCGG